MHRKDCVRICVPLMHGGVRCSGSHRSSCGSGAIRHTKDTSALKKKKKKHIELSWSCVQDLLLIPQPFLTLWHWEECVEGGTDRWCGGWGGGCSLEIRSLSLYLESLLMTRISAPFSSLSRWLSAFRSTRACRKEKIKKETNKND